MTIIIAKPDQESCNWFGSNLPYDLFHIWHPSRVSNSLIPEYVIRLFISEYLAEPATSRSRNEPWLMSACLLLKIGKIWNPEQTVCQTMLLAKQEVRSARLLELFIFTRECASVIRA
jgi:hypothetical protein